jgi:soluble lytic murein transglycosylase-like protein
VPAAKVEPRMQGSPAVQPFLRLRLVEEELARGNAQNAAAVASEIIALGDTSSATTSATTIARLRLPTIYAQLGDRASADAAWQQAMLIPIDELTEEDFVALGTALAKNGRDDLAIKTRMRLLTEYTQGRFTEQTYGFLRSEVMKLPESDQLAIAKQLARYDRYDQALEILDRLTRTDEVRNARLRALFNSRHYEQLLEETKDTKLDDPALALLRARAAWRADRRPEFLAGLDAVNTPEANLLRSKYYTTDEIDYPRALDNLKKAIDAGALGTDGENLWSLGYTYVLAGKYQEALQTFDRYIAAYPDGDWKTNSLFWSAKIFDRAGRTAERDAKARQILDEYPFSYYSYRAKELWSDVGAAALSGTATAEGSGRHMEFPDIATFPDEPRLAVVRELLDLGLARDATREMKLIAAKYPDHPAIQFMLADVYVKGGEPLKANGVLQRRFRQFVRHGGANIPRRFWEILFPLPHWDVIQKEAEKRALDPYLIASIIRQESAFEPSTVSNAGAVGLMQIMPEEASRIAGTEITRESLFDPATNIAVGAAEYSQKLAMMNGNPTLAVAAYNAGEEAVQGWTAITPLDDIDLFIESIPFAETRLYVKTVNRNRNEYRRIYQR